MKEDKELLDLRNEDGSLTGEKKERALVHRDGDLHGTSHLWLVRYRKEPVSYTHLDVYKRQ